jgi:hypothetical protein
MYLKTELETCGYPKTAEAFRDRLADIFSEMYPGQTVEDLLIDELEPRRFVGVVRSDMRCPKLAHELILKTLLNIRRLGNLSLYEREAGGGTGPKQRRGWRRARSSG